MRRRAVDSGPRISTLATFCEASLRRVGPQTVDLASGSCPYDSVSREQIEAALAELVNAGRASFDPDTDHYSISHAHKLRT